jgi:hypothetical protein
MNPIARSWKTPFALIVTIFALWAASVQLGSRSAAARMQAEMPPASADVPQGDPPSNQIADFPQLD